MTLLANEEGKEALDAIRQNFEGTWADLFIVSDVEVLDDAQAFDAAAETPVEGVRVLVSEAHGIKCPRCWKHTETNREDGLCARCAQVIAEQLAE